MSIFLHCCVVFDVLIIIPRSQGRGIKRWYASDVCLSVCLHDDVWRLSRASCLSREQRSLERLKLAEVAHVTRDSDTTSKVKRSMFEGPSPSAEEYPGPDSVLLWYYKPHADLGEKAIISLYHEDIDISVPPLHVPPPDPHRGDLSSRPSPGSTSMSACDCISVKSNSSFMCIFMLRLHVLFVLFYRVSRTEYV